MYKELLSLAFEEARDTYAGVMSNCNSSRLLITFNNHEGNLGTLAEKSDVIVLYDMIDRKPLMLIERIKSGILSEKECNEKLKYIAGDFTSITSESGDGSYIDITIIRRATYETLTAEC